MRDRGGQTGVSLALPRRRRRARILRPSRVRMRVRNPCLRTRFVLLLRTLTFMGNAPCRGSGARQTLYHICPPRSSHGSGGTVGKSAQELVGVGRGHVLLHEARGTRGAWRAPGSARRRRIEISGWFASNRPRFPSIVVSDPWRLCGERLALGHGGQDACVALVSADGYGASLHG